MFLRCVRSCAPHPVNKFATGSPRKEHGLRRSACASSSSRFSSLLPPRRRTGWPCSPCRPGPAPPAVEAKLPRGMLRIPGGTKQQPPEAPVSAPPPPAAPPPPTLVSPPPPADEDPLVTIIRETTTAVEQVRGLRRKQNLKVQILDDKLFSAAVREKAKKELTPAVVAAARARRLAFNLAPPAGEPAQAPLALLA